MPRPLLGCWARTPSPGASEAEVVPRRTAQDRAAAIGTDQSPPGPPVVGRHRFVVATDLKNQTSVILLFGRADVTIKVISVTKSWQEIEANCIRQS